MTIELGSGVLFVDGEWIGRSEHSELEVKAPDYKMEALAPDEWPDVIMADFA